MGEGETDQEGVLPQGTVTFLFTDIEGSTRRWEVHGDAMASCIARHDELLNQAITASQGRVIKSMGDGVMAVFTNVADALQAATAGQHAIGAEDWGPVPALRVRMGIHTGWAQPAGGDYVGAVVNRAARIADAGHGGQVLLSSASAAVVETVDQGHLASRGEVRLKDLTEPIELFQLQAPGLENDLLPLRTLDADTRDLPVQRTTFLGREPELERASRALESNRLVTLVGPGGVGKTRLASQVGAELSQQFDAGVRFVDLAEVGEGGNPAAATLDQLLRRTSSPTTPGPVDDPLDGLIRTLAGSETLLILDNCEHVVEEASLVVDTLLDNCHQLRVLATSREPLRIPGEQVIVVTPLVPPTDLDEPMASAAVRLFVERHVAGGAEPPDAAGLRTVGRICQLVDGLPLGIELAAARGRHLPLDELATRLEAHHRILEARDRTRPDRHRTIEGLLRWSYELLEPGQRQLLARLGMFVGPVDVAAIEAACVDPDDPFDTIADLGALVDRSLVVYDESSRQYALLNIVRGFARDELSAASSAPWELRHAEWCVTSLEEANREDTDEALARFMRRHAPEVLAALNWAIDTGRAELSWRLADGAWRWYEMTGRPREGLDLVQRALDTGSPADTTTWAAVASGAANLAMVLGDVEYAKRMHGRAGAASSAVGDTRAEAWARTGLAMALMMAGDATATDEAGAALGAFEALDDRRGIGHAQASLGIIAARRGDAEAAQHHYLEALSMLRLAGQRRDAASVLSNLGNLSEEQGDHRRATRFYDGALQLYREVEDHRGAGLILNNLSVVAGARGDGERAIELAEEAVAEFNLIHDRQGAAGARHNLANLAAAAGDTAGAFAFYRQAIEGFRDARDPRGVITTLDAAARLATATDNIDLAWKLHLDKATVLARLGLERATQRALNDLAQLAHHRGDPDLSAQLRDAAMSMVSGDVSKVLEVARVAVGPGPGADAPSDVASEPAEHPLLGALTRRELELLAAVGEGKTNTEIAEDLFISRRTVDAHLSHIRTKLGVSDRSKLIVLARETLVGSTHEG